MCRRGLNPAYTLELPQKSEVVLKKEPYIIYAVFQHGDPLDPHAERKACDFFRVVSDIFEYLRVHHPCAHYLEPPLASAHTAFVLSAAYHTRYINLGARLREREETRPEAHLRLLAEYPLREYGESAF